MITGLDFVGIPSTDADRSRAFYIDTGVCYMALFSDPDGNSLMLHHRHTPR
ncbi:MAG: hypothetical protein QG596_1175 [Actinomycetota bacterium]|jgi:catechol 2,3-dioxygenase-like lactoylglutathione lyase family enzyme|nr:hypothetical protein [Actinomycetota bacterium]